MVLRLLRTFGLLLLMIAALAACTLQDGMRSASPTTSDRNTEKRQAISNELQQLSPQLVVGRDGILHLSWMTAERSGSRDILYARSQDHGATWQEPPISLKSDKKTVAGGLVVATGPKGHLYAAWRQSDLVPKKQHRLILAHSVDGGKSWSEPAREIASSPTIGFPHLLVDDDGSVHVAWLEGHMRGGRHLELTTSRDFGKTFASESTYPGSADPASKSGLINVRIASDGTGRIYVVWEENTRSGSSRIYLRRSTDHGRTWTENPILVSPSEEIALGNHAPQIVTAPGGRVAIMWEQFDERSVTLAETGRPKHMVDKILVVNRSLDEGQSWLAKPIRLNVIDRAGLIGVDSLHARLSADQQNSLYAVWVEADGRIPKRLLFSHSSDFGSTWSVPPVQLERTSPERNSQLVPLIRQDDRGHVWVLWQERAPDPDGWQVVMNRSENSGQDWRRRVLPVTGPEHRLETLRGTSFQVDADGRMFVAWDGGRQGPQEITVARSLDAGRTWLPQPVRIGRP